MRTKAVLMLEVSPAGNAFDWQTIHLQRDALSYLQASSDDFIEIRVPNNGPRLVARVMLSEGSCCTQVLDQDNKCFIFHACCTSCVSVKGGLKSRDTLRLNTKRNSINGEIQIEVTPRQKSGKKDREIRDYSQLNAGRDSVDGDVQIRETLNLNSSENNGNEDKEIRNPFRRDANADLGNVDTKVSDNLRRDANLDSENEDLHIDDSSQIKTRRDFGNEHTKIGDPFRKDSKNQYRKSVGQFDGDFGSAGTNRTFPVGLVDTIDLDLRTISVNMEESVRVLKRVPIRFLEAVVCMKTDSDVLHCKRNIPGFLTDLKSLISMYGVVNNCTIDCSRNHFAQQLNVEKIYLMNVEFSLPEQPNIHGSHLVGYTFEDNLSNNNIRIHIDSKTKANKSVSLNYTPDSQAEDDSGLLGSLEDDTEEISYVDSSVKVEEDQITQESQSSPRRTCADSYLGHNTESELLLRLYHSSNRSSDATTVSTSLPSTQSAITTSTQSTIPPSTPIISLSGTETITTPITSSRMASSSAMTTCSDNNILIGGLESLEGQQWKVEGYPPVGGMEVPLATLKQLIEDVRARGVEAQGQCVLLEGPPGSGKALMVQNACAATNTPLITINCHQHNTSSSKDYGSKDNVSSLSKSCAAAELLCQMEPCVFFLRDVDQLLLRDGGVRLMQKFQISKSIDCCMSHGSIVIISSSNRNIKRGGEEEDYTDDDSMSLFLKALGGSSGEAWSVGFSTIEYRASVLKALLLRADASIVFTDEHSQKVASLTPGLLGADLHKLVQAAEDFLQRENNSISAATAKELVSSLLHEAEEIIPSLIQGSPVLATRPEVSRLGGMEDLQGQLQLLLTQMMFMREFNERLHLAVPRGVLLYGPPGCGKTQMMCTLAASRGCSFFVVQSTDILSPYVGETEKQLHQVFRDARAARPAIVFFDEIDGLLGDREDSSSKGGVRQRLLTEMLQIMDGASTSTNSGDGETQQEQEDMDGIMVCAATNNPNSLDAALLRPGRFDKLIYVPPPDREQRLQILKVKCSNVVLPDTSVLEQVADMTEMLTGSDLQQLVRSANDRALLSGSVSHDNRVVLSRDLLMECAEAHAQPVLTPTSVRQYQMFCGGNARSNTRKRRSAY
uniref:Transitional endoplasmic reticulum ATPase homolog 1-like isoform X3 n=2 Tax=Hirondellea gigas TaxID=1518452 RepID=A0A6A7FPG1_9CRUS